MSLSRCLALLGLPIIAQTGVPFFTSNNITNFLERFKDYYNDIRIIALADKVKRILAHYNSNRRDKIKEMNKYIKRSQEALKTALLKEY